MEKNSSENFKREEKKKEKKEKLSNFEKIDLEILIKQNKSLLNELNRRKSEFEKMEKNSKGSTFEKTKGSTCDFLDFFGMKNKLMFFSNEILKRLNFFKLKSEDDFLNSFFNFFLEIFGELKNFLENYENQDLSEFNEFFEKKGYLFENFEKNLNEFFNNKFNEKKNNFSSEIEKDKNLISVYENKISKLEKINLEITKEKKDLLENLEKLKKNEFSKKYENLKIILEEKNWNNSILQKRLSFYQNYEIGKISKMINLLKDEKIYYCFCGGKYFSEIPNKININLLIEKLKNSENKKILDSEKKISEKKNFGNFLNEKKISLEKHNLIINNLKKEISELIEISEKRRVDKLSLTEKILNCEFFGKIEENFKNTIFYVKNLENKYLSVLENLVDFDFLRKKELEEYKDKENFEKKKLEKIILNLKIEIENFKIKIENNKFLKKNILEENKKNENDIDLKKIIKKLNLEIKNISENISKNLFEKIKKLEEENSRLKNSNENFENKNILGPDILNREFRHKQHKNLFKVILKKFEDDKIFYKNLQNFEKYVKMRERKIRGLEKDLYKKKKDFENEKNQSVIYLQEISNSSETFCEQQKIIDNLKNDVESLTTNFNFIFKEKNDLEKKLNFRIKKLDLDKNDLEHNTDQKTIKINSLLNLNKKVEENLKKEKTKNFENKKIIENLISEKSQNLNLIENFKINDNLKKNRLLAYEESNKKLSKEISQNLILINEKEIIIKNILESKNININTKENLSINQKEQFYLNLLELKRLRNIVECKACKIGQKEVILTTCFHTFCGECIDKNIQDRSRKCPVCLMKFNKYNVEKMFID